VILVLKSYLSIRKQILDLEFIKTHSYGWETDKRGVLGMKLFIMYINDFPK
jgi:hypothetical protein